MTKEEFINIRKELGLSQTAYGEVLGLKLRQVQYLESGEKTISKTVEKLALMILKEKQLKEFIEKREEK